MRYQQKGSNYDGYFFFLVVNNSKDMAFRETAEFQSYEGFTLLEPHSGNGYDVHVEPGEQQCVLAHVSSQSNSFKL